MNAPRAVSGIRHDVPGVDVAALQQRADGRSPFTRLMNLAMSQGGDVAVPASHQIAKSPATDTLDLRDAAAKLVSTALVQPALTSMHDSPLRPTAGPFARSGVEKRFDPLLDQQFADRITKAAKFGLVNRIVDRFEKLADRHETAVPRTGIRRLSSEHSKA